MSGVAPAGVGGPVGAAGGQPQQAQGGGGWSLGSIARMLMFYYVISSFFKGGKQPQPVTDVTTGIVQQPHRPMWNEHTPYDMYVYVHHDKDLNINQYTAAQLNPSRLVWIEKGLSFGSWESRNERALNWTFTDQSWMLPYLQQNHTLFAHTFFVRHHTPLFKWRGINDPDDNVDAHAMMIREYDDVDSEDGTSYALSHVTSYQDLAPIPSTDSEGFNEKYVKNSRFNPANIVHRYIELNIYRPPPKIVNKKNLLGVNGGEANVSSEVAIAEEKKEEITFDDEEEEEIQQWLEDDDDAGEGSSIARHNAQQVSRSKKKKNGKAQPWLSYWKPFLSIRLIPDWTVFPLRGIPEEMRADFVIDPKTNQYEPVVYFDYFWLLTDQLSIINNTVSHLSLNMSHSPLSLLKWRMEMQMEASWKMQQNWGMQEEDGRESEMFKKMVLETNVYLLVVTFVVSMLHMVFDFLAFKNDVAFWKEAKSMKGLSTRSILLNCFCQAIIFLYLLDNDTSYMILVSSGIGIVIEVWKVQKALVIRIDRTRPFPYIRILNKSLSEDKEEDDKTEEEKELELHAQYDAEAMRYMSYVLYPLIVCYAIYSLYYDTHKSWYSFILNVLTGCVYTFGFIMMCPQLYLNYKLKSVAHLPWRMLTYKALNTFIDDLFAFIITMPTMHRMACLRDDVIFFIYLYQKWAYRVDYKRVNEFGTVLMSEEEQAALIEADRKKAEEEEEKKKNAPIQQSQLSESKRGAYLEEIQDGEEETTQSAEPTGDASSTIHDSALADSNEDELDADAGADSTPSDDSSTLTETTETTAASETATAETTLSSSAPDSNPSSSTSALLVPTLAVMLASDSSAPLSAPTDVPEDGPTQPTATHDMPSSDTTTHVPHDISLTSESESNASSSTDATESTQVATSSTAAKDDATEQKQDDLNESIPPVATVGESSPSSVPAITSADEQERIHDDASAHTVTETPTPTITPAAVDNDEHATTAVVTANADVDACASVPTTVQEDVPVATDSVDSSANIAADNDTPTATVDTVFDAAVSNSTPATVADITSDSSSNNPATNSDLAPVAVLPSIMATNESSADSFQSVRDFFAAGKNRSLFPQLADNWDDFLTRLNLTPSDLQAAVDASNSSITMLLAQLATFSQLGRSFDTWSDLVASLNEARRTASCVSEEIRQELLEYLAHEDVMLFSQLTSTDMHIDADKLDHLLIAADGLSSTLHHLYTLDACGRKFQTFHELSRAVLEAKESGEYVTEEDRMALKSALLTSNLFATPLTNESIANLSQSDYNRFFMCSRQLGFAGLQQHFHQLQIAERTFHTVMDLLTALEGIVSSHTSATVSGDSYILEDSREKLVEFLSSDIGSALFELYDAVSDVEIELTSQDLDELIFAGQGLTNAIATMTQFNQEKRTFKEISQLIAALQAATPNQNNP